MRDFDVKDMQMTNVDWVSGWHRFELRRVHHPEESLTELILDDVVVLRLHGEEFDRLRDAMDIVSDSGTTRQGAVALLTRALRTPARPKPANGGKAWTQEDEDTLVARFKAGDSPKQLADELGRSTASINLRLVKLGLVEGNPDGWRGMN